MLLSLLLISSPVVFDVTDNDVLIKDSSVYILKDQEWKNEVNLVDSIDLLLPKNLAYPIIDEYAAEALRQLLANGNFEGVRIDPKPCGEISRPCRINIRHKESQKSIIPKILRTCWFRLKDRYLKEHYNQSEHFKQCKKHSLGAFQYINTFELNTQNENWEDKWDQWKVRAYERWLQVKRLFVKSHKVSRGVSVKIYPTMLPTKNIQSNILQSIKLSQNRIDISTFNLSDPLIYDLLNKKLQEGVKVRILYDFDFMFSNTRIIQLASLANSGAQLLPMTFGGTNEARPSFHSKVYLFDDRIYLGTFNLGKTVSQTKEQALYFNSDEWKKEILTVFDYWHRLACSNRNRTIAAYQKSCKANQPCEDILASYIQSCTKETKPKLSLSHARLQGNGLEFMANGEALLDSLYSSFRDAKESIKIKSSEITYLPLLSYLDSLAKEKKNLKVSIYLSEFKRHDLESNKYPNLHFIYEKDWSHEKTIVIDKSRILITSANLSHRGLFYNIESSIMFNLSQDQSHENLN